VTIRRSFLVRYVVVIFAALVLLTGCSGPKGTASSTSTTLKAAPRSALTQLEFYEPWTDGGDLKSNLHVASTLSGGTCWTSSIGDPDENNAWRCMTDNDIYDPCFAPELASTVTTVACAQSPQSDVLLLHLSTPSDGPLTGTGPAANGHPWYLLLANGQPCGAIDNDWGTAHGVALPYGCPSGQASNPIVTQTRPWTVRYLAKGSKTLIKMTVTTAWV